MTSNAIKRESGNYLRYRWFLSDLRVSQRYKKGIEGASYLSKIKFKSCSSHGLQFDYTIEGGVWSIGFNSIWYLHYTPRIKIIIIAMIATQLMLRDLQRWVKAHGSHLEDYLRGYPYANYLAIDATNLLRNNITDIVKHISTQVRASPLAAHARYSGSPRPALSHPQVNILCQIKLRLDDIRTLFLAVEPSKTITLHFVLRQIEEMILLASTPVQILQKHQPRDPQRNRSFDAVQKKQTDRNLPLHWERMGERERTACLRNRLHQEMLKDLRKQEQSGEERRRRRVISDYRAVLSKGTSSRDHQSRYEEEKREKGSVSKNRIQRPVRNLQKRFKYICYDDEEEEKGQEQENQKDKEQRADKLEAYSQKRMETPDRNKFKTLPSTENKSTSQKTTEPEFDFKFPQFDFKEGQLASLEGELNWQQLQLSGIKVSEAQEQPAEEDLCEYLEKDSLQIEQSTENNLDDSLEIMKQKETLNKTGTFGTAPLANPQSPYSTGKEVQQYSFSHD